MNKKIIIIVSSIVSVLLISVIGVIYLNKNNVEHKNESNSSLKVNNTTPNNSEKEVEYSDVRKIMDDEYLKSLKEKLSITIKDTEKYIDRFILPKKIGSKNVKTIDVNNFYKQYNHIYDGIIENIKKGEEIDIKYPKDWKVLNIENLQDKNLNYSKNTREIKIISCGKGIYKLEFQLENGDIVNLIFT